MSSPVTPIRRVTNVDALRRRQPEKPKSLLRRAWPLALAVVLTLGLLTVSVFTGVADITDTVGRGHEFTWITRIPRTSALVLAGASMAMAGLIMQLMTQNRFVEPTTVGTTEWAGLGLLLTYIVLPAPDIFTRMAVAIVFAFAGTLIFFAFLRRVTLKSSLIVPIVGIMFGAVISAISTFIALQFDLLQTLGSWFAGRFTGVEVGRYEPLWIVLIIAVIVVVIADRFTVAGLGKEVATNVGLNYERIVLLGVGLVAIVTGVVTVVIGALPFLGLIVPNLVSLVRGDNLRTNIPWVFLTGIWVVTVCDLIGRVVIMPFEVPVSLVLGAVGAAVFIFLLLRTRRVNVR
ncbi:iron chelate uptake ABC transporter family permease subunit [uncultured Agrococcus sp.]|uniref:ABC transporter permease n=1 Tax=uncultured Agrococcus sp. TaxID=382258 RepID=UPI0025EC898F|nr:iron chelate uptake ABC transporter family permease subunit [uncultured Agrococcus sp.]